MPIHDMYYRLLFRQSGYYGQLQIHPLFQESLHSHSLPNDSIRQNKFQVPENQEVGLENQGVELCQTGPLSDIYLHIYGILKCKAVQNVHVACSIPGYIPNVLRKKRISMLLTKFQTGLSLLL
jgi:hypothetical protein